MKNHKRAKRLILSVFLCLIFTHNAFSNQQGDNFTPYEFLDIDYPDHKLIDKFRNEYSSGFGLKKLQETLDRAAPYRPYIRRKLMEKGMPLWLEFLPIIESNFNIKAMSKSGAAGLWQFMPATGREYGLEVNDNIDERYHIEKATRAACSYLKKQYRQFGDWMTVAASYNGGPGGVKSKQAAQGVESAMDMYLVEETSRYMFRILTAKLVFSDPRRYGFVLRSEDLYPYIPPKDTVTVTKPITDLAAFARQHGVTFAQLKNENLWLRESSLNNKSGRTYSLKIPDGKALFYNPRETKAHDRRWVINR